MGNMCTPSIDQYPSSTTQNNYQLAKVMLGQSCTISIIQGTAQQQTAETLTCVSSFKTFKNNPDLIELAYHFNLQKLKIRKQLGIYDLKPNKKSPYQKICLILLPDYQSNQSDDFHNGFINCLRELFEHHHDICFSVGLTLPDINQLPTQTLLGLMFQYLSVCIVEPRKVSLISLDRNCLNMIKYELMKTQKCKGNLIWEWDIRF